MRTPTVDELCGMVRSKRYLWFTGAYNLNLVVLRAIPGTTDWHDDLFVAAYQDENLAWQLRAWPCSADPGRPALLSPGRIAGAAIIAPGQHRQAYGFGTHKGRYPCLVPVRPIPCWRDGNRDEVIDYGGDEYSSSLLQIHRGPALASSPVGPWSEGCVDICGAPPLGLDELLVLCHLQVKYGRGDRFSLTMLEVSE